MPELDPASADSPSAQRQPMPRWVIGLLIAAVVLAILVVVLLATGHGPGRHMSAQAGTPSPLVAGSADL